MNLPGLCDLTYGMYIISTEYDGKLNGQIANVGGQLTAVPPRVGICLNKNTLTCELVLKRKAFTLSVLGEDATMKFIGHFDKMTMNKGEAAMRTEFERLVPTAAKGGFLISCDHQTPPGVSYAEYQRYLVLFREYAEESGRLSREFQNTERTF